MASRKKRLGKGLSSLIAKPVAVAVSGEEATATAVEPQAGPGEPAAESQEQNAATGGVQSRKEPESQSKEAAQGAQSR